MRRTARIGTAAAAAALWTLAPRIARIVMHPLNDWYDRRGYRHDLAYRGREGHTLTRIIRLAAATIAAVAVLKTFIDYAAR